MAKQIFLGYSVWLLVFLLPTAGADATPRFTDVTAAAGIDFVHYNGALGEKYVPETLGPGGAFFDYDGDGDLDIYLINGAPPPEEKMALEDRPTNKLYRNEGDGTFTDVTAAAGVADTTYGMGCSAADVDNDGDLDLYLTNFGADVFYRNEGYGTFIDATEQAGLGNRDWGSSCAFADVDGDGFVDLYVATYFNFTYDTHKICTEGGRDLQLYCGPQSYDAVSDVLYHNEGDGTFTDITVEAGVQQVQGKELGVVFGDVDLDGDQDLYLASDRTFNFLFINDGHGQFEDQALLAGSAFNEDGEVEAGMGVDMDDYDNDRYPDLFITNFQWESNTLFHNLGDGSFIDETFNSGLGSPSIPFLAWGNQFFDYDNDGDRDLFVANGHLESDVEVFQSTTFGQTNLLFENQGRGRFEPVENVAGTALGLQKISRGAAVGDYDEDGDLDILVTNCTGSTTLMRNDGDDKGYWLQVRLQGTKSNRAAIGTRVEILSDGREQMDEVRAGGSYLSQSDLRLFFGLGAGTKVDRLRVFWPSGLIEEADDIPINQEVTLIEGQMRQVDRAELAAAREVTVSIEPDAAMGIVSSEIAGDTPAESDPQTESGREDSPTLPSPEKTSRASQEASDQRHIEVLDTITGQAKLHFDRGVAMAAQGRDTEAISAYRQAAEIAPGYPAIYYNLGNAYARQLNFAQAIPLYRQTLELDPGHISARHHLAAMYVKQLNFTQAIQEHNQVLELDPGHVVTYLDLAYIHYTRAEYPRARSLIEKGLELTPDDPSFYRLLGHVFVEELKFDQASRAYTRAVVLDSTDATTYAALGKSELKLGNYQTAVAACKRAIALNPLGEATDYFALAHARAVSSARIASPGLTKEAYFTLANAYRQLGRLDESRRALAEFSRRHEESTHISETLRLLANAPDDHEARAVLGLLYMRQGRFEEAAEAYRLATHLAPDSSRYFNNLGNAYLRLKDYEQAVQTYAEAVHLSPEYGTALFNLGLAYLHSQRFIEAREVLLRAHQLLPKHAEVHYYLGLIYGREGEYEKAVEMFEQALAARPDFMDARQKLAVSYLKLGRYEQSKKELRVIDEMRKPGMSR